MPADSRTLEAELLARALHRRLHVHCYRMLGSPHDADDAVQETLLAAWRGIASFERRSAQGTWLYQISTRTCLRLIAQRPQRLSSPDYAPAPTSTADLGQMVGGTVWVEPLPDENWLADALQEEPASALQQRQSVALAFIAALQHLPGTQRAVLLRDVLEYSAGEAAEMLGTSTASVNSALQRAQKPVKDKMSGNSQAVELQALQLGALDELLRELVDAWESRDVAGLVSLLAENARFTIPPLPAWFDGRQAVAKFISERMFATPWRLRPIWANSHPGFACYMQHPGSEKVGHLGQAHRQRADLP